MQRHSAVPYRHALAFILEKYAIVAFFRLTKLAAKLLTARKTAT